MLQYIRKHTSSWVAKILFFVLILSFGVWGVGDSLRSRFGGDDVAQVGDNVISKAQVSRAMREEINRLRKKLGSRIDTDPMLQMEVAQLVLLNLIQGQLLDLEAKKLKLVISDDTIREIVHAQFRTKSGTFDREKFNAAMYNSGLTESGYLYLLRDALKKEFLTKAIAVGGDAPSPIAAPLFKQSQETRNLTIVEIPLSSVKYSKKPSEETLKKFYEENKNLFVEPERRTLSSVILDPKKLIPAIKKEHPELSDDEHRQEALSRIYKQANELEDSLASGATLKESANALKLSFHLLEKVDVRGKTASGRNALKDSAFTKEILKTGFELSQNFESDLKETEDGKFYIVMPEESVSKSVPPLNTIQKKVSEKYMAANKFDLAKKEAIALVKNINGTGKLGKILYKTRQVSGVSMQSPPKDLPENLLPQVFSLPVKKATAVPNAKGYLVAMVTKITPTKLAKDHFKFTAYRQNLGKEMNQEIFIQFLGALQQHFPVTINNKALQEMVQD
ncbi:MAG: hypothetical protein HOI80_03640 [Alphaproteobacteria bacterium]|jgi:hypothetical protein|nr:hypothetical protein [Alphaproteobacteria bacterium]MBT5390035.1 hypothetical protein [Alphaproteobacteria bacterium]MBT5540665.1 hypothetical protein [Alphaproteobacteria bacterium]MBT5654578.1 hypothetical protein [Alphaproteobacteria bacterium]